MSVDLILPRSVYSYIATHIIIMAVDIEPKVGLIVRHTIEPKAT